MSMRELIAAGQRLSVLLVLVDCGGNANDGLLQTCLDTYGHRLGVDAIRAHLAWLDEMGLVTAQHNASLNSAVATLTSRGQDVAEGRATVPGVQKPRFGG